MKRFFCLLACTTCLAGCGGTLGQVSSSANNVTHHISLWQAGWCAFHGYRLVHDYRTGHMGWGALQGVLTAYHCTKLIESIHR